MELRKGYKQTDVGLIPEDWLVVELNKLSEKIMVGIASSATHAYRDTGVVMFRNQNIKPNYLDDSDILFIHPDYEVVFKNKRLKEGDLLTARTGYPGTTCKVPKKYEGAQSFTTLITRIKLGTVITDYICFYLNSEKGKLFFDQNQIGGGQKNVNAGTLQIMPIPLPPTLAEQTAIATALSDMDKLIGSLEQLIEKKKAIKQGAMQELLRPKEGWVVKKLGEVGNCHSGGTPSTFNSDYWSGNIVWLPSGRVQNNILVKQENEITITELGLKESAAKLIKVNSVLIAITGATCGNIGLLQFEAAANQSVVAIEPFDKYDYKYLYYLLLTIRGVILSNQTGSAQGGVNLKTIKNIEVELPEDEKEQIKISTILYDMDNEISALEQNFAKCQMLKKGMMQELLTGKTRLV